MKMTKVELTNVVEVTYYDKNDGTTTLETAMVAVPEDSFPPMSEEDKKYGGRLLDVYFKKATEILTNERESIYIYPDGFRFMGDITLWY